MRDLAVEQIHMVRPNWNGLVLAWLEGTCQVKIKETSQKTPRKIAGPQQNAHCCSCLVSDSTILLTQNVLPMTTAAATKLLIKHACHSKPCS